ncbi:hypothetical protein Tco_1467356 [Tanacetum coccineum]
MKKRLGKKESVSKQGRKKAKPGPTLDVFDDLDADGRDYIEIEDVVKEGRQSNETEKLKLTTNTEEIAEDKGSNVNAARQEISTVEPRIPSTTKSIFDDKEITMAQTLIKMKEEKAKEKGVAIKEVEEFDRPARSILT